MNRNGKLISVPVSYGELLDKISILEIKMEHISDISLREKISLELGILDKLCKSHLDNDYKTNPAYKKLKKINKELWVICDDRRLLDEKNQFGETYISLSRSEYKTNDQRALVKKLINQQYNSELIEVKSYDWFDL